MAPKLREVLARTGVPFHAPDYRYQVVGAGGAAGFEAVDYDDSAFATGAAPFGTAEGICPWNTSSNIGTTWPVNTDVVVRRAFALPASARNLRVAGTVDNDATVYVNGTQIGSTLAGFCIANTISFTAPDAVLHSGANLLAVRGHDYGDATFLHQTVAYDVPVYSICPLYDPAKAHKSGSTVPLELQLCDASGANLSSTAIRVHATDMSKVDSTASTVVEDSGAANDDDDFRFSDSRYIFNLSTKGLATGTWQVTFTVDGDAMSAYRLLFDVR
jgi:hypothetical protein